MWFAIMDSIFVRNIIKAKPISPGIKKRLTLGLYCHFWPLTYMSKLLLPFLRYISKSLNDVGMMSTYIEFL